MPSSDLPISTLVSPARITISEAILQGGIKNGYYTHAAYALAVNGTVAARGAFGAATLDTIFDLASLTKPMATATGAMQLVEAGKLHLLQSVARVFEPEFGPLPHLNDVLVRHLLTHTSGLPPIPRWPNADTKPDRKALLQSILTTPVLRSPGVGYTYSDTGYIILGELVARVAGQELNTLFSEQIAAPLGLTQTGYRPSNAVHAKIAPTGAVIKAGEVHDPRSRDLGGVSGHAGLFGTVEDVLTFAETIRRGGNPILSRASVARMSESQIDRSVGGQSYGWFCVGNDYLPQGDLFSDRAFGHSGFTGTLILIDPTSQSSLVLLTNRVVSDQVDGSRFLKLRRYWLNSMASAIV